MKAKWTFVCVGRAAVAKVKVVSALMNQFALKVNAEGRGHVDVEDQGFQIEVTLDGPREDVEEFKKEMAGFWKQRKLAILSRLGIKQEFKIIDEGETHG